MKKNKLILFFVLIIIVFALFIACIFENYKSVNGYLFLISSLISIFCIYRLQKKFSIGISFVLIYYIVIMPFQMLISLFLPSWLVATRFNKLYDETLFFDNDLMIQYFLLGTICLAIVFLVCRLVELHKRFVLFDYGYKYNQLVIPFPFLWLTLSCLLHIVEMRLNANGVIDYAVRGLSLFFLAQIVSLSVNQNKEIHFRDLFRIFIAVVLYGLPHILVGMRTDFFLAFVYSFIFVFLVNKNGVINYFKKHIFVLLLLVFVFLASFQLISKIKFGEGVDASSNVLYLIIRRMTGLFDGTTILKYLQNNIVKLDYKNFFGVMINEQRNHSTGFRANQFYTFFIQGYPTNDQTGSAAPAFISALFYGPIGWFFIIIYISLLNGLFSKKAMGYLKLIRIHKCNQFIKVNAFICLFALHVTVISFIMGGNYEAIKLLSPVIFCFILNRILSLPLNKNYILGEQY